MLFKKVYLLSQKPKPNLKEEVAFELKIQNEILEERQ